MDLRGGWRTDGAESKVLAQRETSLQYGLSQNKHLSVSDKTQKKEKPDIKAQGGTRCLVMFGPGFA